MWNVYIKKRNFFALLTDTSLHRYRSKPTGLNLPNLPLQLSNSFGIRLTCENVGAVTNDLSTHRAAGPVSDRIPSLRIGH